MDSQPRFYSLLGLLLASLLCLSLLIVPIVGQHVLQLANAVLLAFVVAQLAFISHDAGHGQVFKNRKYNNILFLSLSLLLGVSRSWWCERHDRHHANPNETDTDPDIDSPVLAFTPEQAQNKKGIYRFIARHQALLITPLMALQGLASQIESAKYTFTHRFSAACKLEAVFLIAHQILLVSFLVHFLGPWMALSFGIVHYSVAGLYLSSVFAPNHKGMQVLRPGNAYAFIPKQVLTSRNVSPHPVTDFLYGGLNYQIEHHLFPKMPRNNLRRARPIIKNFCAEQGLPYHETGVLRSYLEIFRHLKTVSRTI